MLGSFYRSRTTRLAPRRVSTLGWRIKALSRISVMGAFALLAAACQTVPDAQPIVTLGPGASAEDISRVTKSDLQQCIAAYYSDEWPSVVRFADRLSQMADRWKELPAPEHAVPTWNERIEAFEAAVKQLKNAADAKDAAATNNALLAVTRAYDDLRKTGAP